MHPINFKTDLEDLVTTLPYKPTMDSELEMLESDAKTSTLL